MPIGAIRGFLLCALAALREIFLLPFDRKERHGGA
jgi:hypothetical protein